MSVEYDVDKCSTMWIKSVQDVTVSSVGVEKRQETFRMMVTAVYGRHHLLYVRAKREMRGVYPLSLLQTLRYDNRYTCSYDDDDDAADDRPRRCRHCLQRIVHMCIYLPQPLKNVAGKSRASGTECSQLLVKRFQTFCEQDVSQRGEG